MDEGFTHLDGRGNARMVDVTGKALTHRRAEARCLVVLTAADQARLSVDAVEVARLAGVHGAKLTWDLVPLCHPLPLEAIDVTLAVAEAGVAITATAETVERTGVEMEALTACAMAALSVVAACSEPATVTHLALWEKRGGRSGTWRRDGGG
jgi:cyclic pyranopterin monophosphate synthase